MHKDTYRLIYGKEDRTSVRGIAMGWIKAIGFTILGVLMIAVDRYFIRKWSTEEQTNFSNRTNERYLTKNQHEFPFLKHAREGMKCIYN